jgi:hypothetical protein
MKGNGPGLIFSTLIEADGELYQSARHTEVLAYVGTGHIQNTSQMIYCSMHFGGSIESNFISLKPYRQERMN